MIEKCLKLDYNGSMSYNLRSVWGKLKTWLNFITFEESIQNQVYEKAGVMSSSMVL